eukprot:4831138-Prymnesium_polylepis.1
MPLLELARLTARHSTAHHCRINTRPAALNRVRARLPTAADRRLLFDESTQPRVLTASDGPIRAGQRVRLSHAAPGCVRIAAEALPVRLRRLPELLLPHGALLPAAQSRHHAAFHLPQ